MCHLRFWQYTFKQSQLIWGRGIHKASKSSEPMIWPGTLHPNFVIWVKQCVQMPMLSLMQYQYRCPTASCVQSRDEQHTGQKEPCLGASFQLVTDIYFWCWFHFTDKQTPKKPNLSRFSHSGVNYSYCHLLSWSLTICSHWVRIRSLLAAVHQHKRIEFKLLIVMWSFWSFDLNQSFYDL